MRWHSRACYYVTFATSPLCDGVSGMNNSILLQIASYSQNFAIDFIIPRVAQAMSYSLNYIQLFLLNLQKLSSRIDTAMTNDD